MDLDRNDHHVYRLMYHFVWIPKYRHEGIYETLSRVVEANYYEGRP